jgi:azurin
MKTKRMLFPSLLSLIILAGIHASASDTKMVTINAYNTLRYSQTRIDARPGQKIVLTLKNESCLPKTAMAHDWVLLRAGTDPKSYAKVALTANADDHIPKSLSNEVIVSIPMLGPQESRTITFLAPNSPGSYPFLCSCPGHSGGGMTGVLLVR